MHRNQKTLSRLKGGFGHLRQRGIGLIEASLFVVISLGLIAGGIVFFQQTSEAARVNEAVKSIVSLQSGVRSLYVSESNFGASGADLGEAAIASGSVTADMVGPNGTIRNQWGGPVTITGHPNTFVVDYRDVPQSACVRLAPHSQAGTGPAGNGIASIAINGVLVDEDGDGVVSPTEAEAACGLSKGSAEPLQMKWAFLADANMRTSAWEVEDALGIDPEETGRETETESRLCGEGFLGNETRSRDHVTLSDNSVVPTEWTAWDRSSCDEIVETSRRTETENSACPTGMVGQTVRTREIIVMSDGNERIGNWTEWDASACAIVEVSRRAESENGTCPTGMLGTATRTRDVAIMSDGSEVPQAWSSWNNSQCAVGEVSRRSESQDGACPTGLLGTATRTREVVVMSDATEVPQVWSSWNNSKCAVGEVSRRTESQNGTCPTGLLGTATRTREVVVMSDATEVPQAWSSWNNAGCAVGEVSRRTENGSAACATGFLGNQTRSRVVIVMSNGTEQPQAWSAWDTAACYIGEVSRRNENQNGACPAGYLGTATRTRVVLVMSNGTEQPQAWSAWNNAACYIGEVSRRTDTQSAACPAGYTGNQTRTQVVIVMSNGTEQPQGWSAYNTSACVINNVVVETRTYRSETIVDVGGGINYRCIQYGTEVRDRWTNGSITRRGWSYSNGSCVSGPAKGATPLDVKNWSDCGVFGQQQYSITRYNVGNGTAPTNAGIVGSAGCGYY